MSVKQQSTDDSSKFPFTIEKVNDATKTEDKVTKKDPTT